MVPVMAWEDRYKYLGVKAGANSTPDMAKQGDDFIKDMEVITRSDLTDWQKLDAIHRFAKPRLVYSMQNQLPSLGWARSLDVKVRSLVKPTLSSLGGQRMPSYTPLGVLGAWASQESRMRYTFMEYPPPITYYH